MKRCYALLCAVGMMLTLLTACNNTAAVTLGTVNDTCYESAFLELGFTLPEGFTFATREQIAEQYGVSAEEQELKDMPIIYDMFAGDEQGNSVSVTLENIRQMSEPVSSPKRYLETYAQALTLQQEQMGFADVQAELTSLPLAERTADALVSTSNFGGTTFYQTYICEMRGNHMALITIVSTNEATYGTLLNSFYAVTATE